MKQHLSEIQIQRAFRATAGCFFVIGLLLPTLFAQFPLMEARFGLSENEIAFFIIIMALGAVPSMIISGLVIGQAGSRNVALIAMPLVLLMPPLFAAAWSYPVFLTIGFVLGLTSGFWDVAANAHGSLLERITNRLFMTSIHALFALGVLVGSSLATLAHQFEVDLVLFFTCLSLASALLYFFILRDFLPPALERDQETAEKKSRGTRPPRLSLFLLGALCVLMMLGIEAEASHYDWLTLYFTKHLGAEGARLDEKWSNLAMVFFSSGLFIARVFGDRIGARIGRPRLLLWGTLIGVGGLIGLILTHSYTLALCAAFLIGFGFAFFFPIFIAAAGRLRGVRSSFAVSLVAAMGWTSIFIGPPLIGFLADYFDSLRIAYWSIVPVAVTVAVFGPWVVFKSRPGNH